MVLSSDKKSDSSILWIDFSKFLAIFAVLINHTYLILYNNYLITITSFYSVSLFILISGILNYKSNESHKDLNYFQSFIRSARKIFLAYLLATFLYQIVSTHFFDLEVYLLYLISFNASGPFYYVSVYIQIMLVSKLLYALIKRNGPVGDVVLIASLLVFSALSNNYTDFFHIYGGGGKLLGGSYLLLFALGMLIEKYGVLSKSSMRLSIFVSVICAGLIILWCKVQFSAPFAIDAKLPFGVGINPPGVTLILYAIIMLFFSWGLATSLSQSKILRSLLVPFAWVGKHTLYIFLYHLLFLNYILTPYLAIENIWFKRLVYLSVMIFGSIALEYVVSTVKKKYIQYVSSPSRVGTNK